MTDIERMADEIFREIDDLISAKTEPLVNRLSELEAGKDAAPEIIRSEVTKAISAVPIPKDGRDGRDIDIEAVRAFIAQAVSELPKPADGQKGKDAEPVDTDALVLAVLQKVPKPADGVNGKDADIAAIISTIESEISDGIERALPAAVQKAIDALMPDLIAKAAALVPVPRDGQDAAPVDVDAVVRQVVALVPAPRDGADGKSVDEAEVLASLTEKMLRAVDALPKPEAGRDGRDAPAIDLDAIVAKAVALIPVPRDGKDAESVDFDSVVAKAVSLIPVPRDGINGKDATEIDVDSVVDVVMKRLPEVKDGRDGIDGKSVTIDELRPIFEAESARWQLEFERSATDVLRRAVENIPKPENGRDGKDALSVEDFEVTLDGRVFTFALRCGENIVKREIKVPFPVDRGVYRKGHKYEHGDVVTYGGSQFIAKRDTETSPPLDDWRCCVHRGKDGIAKP